MKTIVLPLLRGLLPCAFALGLFAGCQRSAAPLSLADIEAVKANYTAWGAAVGKRDYDAMTRLLASDVLVTKPHETPIAGRDATIAWVKTWAPDSKQAWEVLEVLGCSDLAYSRATVTANYTEPDGKKVTERVQSVCLHRRQPDGRWVFARCVNYSVDPLPASAAAKKP